MIELRRTLLLSLDDLLVVVRRFINPACSRAGLHRCLRRNAVSNLRELIPQDPKEPSKSFKDYKPGYVHIDIKYLPQMPDESRRRYLYAAIDRATRWVYVEILPDLPAALRPVCVQRTGRRRQAKQPPRPKASSLPGGQTGNASSAHSRPACRQTGPHRQSAHRPACRPVCRQAGRQATVKNSPTASLPRASARRPGVIPSIGPANATASSTDSSSLTRLEPME